MKFKVGDQVRYIGGDFIVDGIVRINDTGYITKIPELGFWTIVKFDNQGWDAAVPTEYLRLVKELSQENKTENQSFWDKYAL